MRVNIVLESVFAHVFEKVVEGIIAQLCMLVHTVCTNVSTRASTGIDCASWKQHGAIKSESESESEGEGQGERDRETERQRDGETGRQRLREIDRERGREGGERDNYRRNCGVQFSSGLTTTQKCNPALVRTVQK